MSAEIRGHRNTGPEPGSLEQRVATRLVDLLSGTAAVAAHTNFNGLAQLDIEAAAARLPGPDGGLLHLTHHVGHPTDSLPQTEISAKDRDGRAFVVVKGDGVQMMDVLQDTRSMNGDERTTFLESVLHADVDLPGTQRLCATMSAITPTDNGHTEVYLRDLTKVDPHKGLGIKEIQ